MGHFHGHSDDVNGRAVHELLMVVERGRHPKELAGGVGRSASRRRERRDLEIVRHGLQRGNVRLGGPSAIRIRDRKSTRLNSSHLVISYAVFCLKKKKKQTRKTMHEFIKKEKKKK